ncbi:acyltransferase family protein [Salinibius halmophilus]|uniref:acyltransferase family protein n=1 Tax=Salinibius halmophilus TaxID=1853216 RepID=UPI000E6604A7|nr:acyltransferase family protein [Salinibius halmophilus]
MAQGNLAKIDNAKLVLIFLVVLGHLIEPLIGRQAELATLYKVIYAFHMPAFAMLCGVLSKDILCGKQLSKVVVTIIVPFLAFTVVYELLEYFMHGKVSHYTRQFQPYWLLWFLLSLFFWRLLLPLILQLRFPLLFSIALGLLAGYANNIGYFFGVARTFYFLPFFVAGYLLSPSFFAVEPKQWVKYLAFVSAVLTASYLVVFAQEPHHFLYGSFSYQALNQDGFSALLVRAEYYFIAFVLALSLFCLVSSQPNAWSNAGRASLFIYLWHGVLIKLLVYYGLFSAIAALHWGLNLILMAFLALGIVTVLSSNFALQFTERLMLTPLKNILVTQPAAK